MRELKEKIFRLVEEDKEFRYALAARLGILELLERMDRNEEIMKKINENIENIWKNIEKIWGEIRRIWEKLGGHDRKFEEIMKRIEGHDRKFNEILERLDRHEEILLKHEQILVKHEKALGSIGETLGLLTEAFITRNVEDDLIKEARDRGEKVIAIKHKYLINRKYEVDLFIETSEKIYLVEVKSRPSTRDFYKLDRVREFLSSRVGKKVVAVLATFKARIKPKYEELAEKHNIELRLY